MCNAQVVITLTYKLSIPRTIFWWSITPTLHFAWPATYRRRMTQPSQRKNACPPSLRVKHKAGLGNSAPVRRTIPRLRGGQSAPTPRPVNKPGEQPMWVHTARFAATAACPAISCTMPKREGRFCLPGNRLCPRREWLFCLRENRLCPRRGWFFRLAHNRFCPLWTQTLKIV